MNTTVYSDSFRSPEERAEALLRELSLDEKMAQVNTVFAYCGLEQDFDWISSHTAFGIGEVSTLEVRSMKTLKEAASWQRRVHGQQSASYSRHLSYGGSVRYHDPGRHQPALRHRPGRQL